MKYDFTLAYVITLIFLVISKMDYFKYFIKLLFSFAVIFSCLFLGDSFSVFSGLHIPGCIWGLLLLLILLLVKVIPEWLIKPGADLIIANMVVLFVPITVGVVEHYEKIKSAWWIFLIVCLGSIIVTMSLVILISFLQKRLA